MTSVKQISASEFRMASHIRAAIQADAVMAGLENAVSISVLMELMKLSAHLLLEHPSDLHLAIISPRGCYKALLWPLKDADAGTTIVHKAGCYWLPANPDYASLFRIQKYTLLIDKT